MGKRDCGCFKAWPYTEQIDVFAVANHCYTYEKEGCIDEQAFQRESNTKPFHSNEGLLNCWKPSGEWDTWAREKESHKSEYST